MKIFTVSYVEGDHEEHRHEGREVDREECVLPSALASLVHARQRGTVVRTGDEQRGDRRDEHRLSVRNHQQERESDDVE